jgi:hypothetical protein
MTAAFLLLSLLAAAAAPAARGAEGLPAPCFEGLAPAELFKLASRVARTPEAFFTFSPAGTVTGVIEEAFLKRGFSLEAVACLVDHYRPGAAGGAGGDSQAKKPLTQDAIDKVCAAETD